MMYTIGVVTNQPDALMPHDLSFFELINRVIAWLILFVFIACIFLILWGGIKFVLSGGDQENIKKAVNSIKFAVIGLVVVMLSITVVAIIGRIFGVNWVYDIINYNKIFADIQMIIQFFTTQDQVSGPTSINVNAL